MSSLATKTRNYLVFLCRCVRIAFVDGTVESRRALFVRPPQTVGSDVPRQLGCEMTETGLIRVGSDRQSSIRGVYAAGDAATAVQQVVVAAAAGAEAAMVINRDLVQAELDSH